MSLKYIAYENENEEHFAVVFLGNLMPCDLHTFLKQQQPQVFTRAISAGFTYFDVKKKKFVTTGDCATLNLISAIEDAELVTEAMTKNGPADLFVVPHRDGVNWSFLFGPKNLIERSALERLNIFGRGYLKFHIHDSKLPFRMFVEVMKGFSMADDFLSHCEQQFA